MTRTLEMERLAFNEASKINFKLKKNSIVDLHSKFYKNFRKSQANSLADVVVQAENECLSAYRSVKSNRHKITKPIEKKKLSYRLNCHLYKFDLQNKRIKLTCLGGKRIWATLSFYPKLEEMINKYRICDPLIFERDNEVFLSMTFDTPNSANILNKKAIGVDLGIRRIASLSNGQIITDKEYLKKKRQIRYLKRQLQSKGTKSAKKHLKKIRHKEFEITDNFCHKICNEILKSDANTIVIEDLSQIKNPKNKSKKKYQNLNKISQVPFYKIRMFLTYKAQLLNKQIEVINPAFTSQIDHRTGLKDGIRKGCRYIGKDNVILDADLNAANNICIRSKLPNSNLILCKALDGQAIVTKLNIGSNLNGQVISDKPANLFVGK